LQHNMFCCIPAAFELGGRDHVIPSDPVVDVVHGDCERLPVENKVIGAGNLGVGSVPIPCRYQLPVAVIYAAPLGSNGIGVALSHVRVPVFRTASVPMLVGGLGGLPGAPLRHSDVLTTPGWMVPTRSKTVDYFPTQRFPPQ
jgi:hypothetical protein